ncbi:unnamed protein product [Victoria cruziana]
MNFVVRVCSGGARSGVLQIASCPAPLETPALVLPTRKGLPVFITRDLLQSLPSPDSHIFQVSPLHFLECPSPKTISSIGGVHQLLGLHDYGFAAVARDSLVSLPDNRGTNRMGASFDTPSGRRLLKPEEYMELMCSLRPNIWASMADEVPAWVSEKRNATSVDRTVRWLDDCISLDPANGAAVLGTVVGGSSLEQRRRCACEVAKRNVAGFCIGGFGLGEDMEERPALLNAVTEALPKEKVRYICGLGLPEEVLQGVHAGIDLFDTTYIYHLTIGGFALVFPLDNGDGPVHDYVPHYEGGDFTKINLRATIYRKDTSPLVEGCSCYSCQNHTRAYINHLLNVHEMLAQILLEIHNTHHYLAFFQLVRKAIKQGNFERFSANFIARRRNHLVKFETSVVEVMSG